MRRFPVEITSTLMVEAVKRFVLMKLEGEVVCMKFCTMEVDAVKVEATREAATMELETWREPVWIAPVTRLPFVLIIAVELRLNWLTPSATMLEPT